MIYKNKKVFSLLIITVAAFILMSILEPTVFLTLRNFQSMTVQIPEFGLLALGIMICMLTGGIDLSVVATANLAAITAAIIMTKFAGAESGANLTVTLTVIALSIFAAFIVGIICGFINGMLVTRLGITPILATLGTMGLFGGLGVIITKGKGIVGFPPQFLIIGTAHPLAIPLVLYIFLGVVLILGVVLNRTMFGFNIYMIGANPLAACFSGININNVLVRVYMSSGLLAGIAAILMIARVNSARSGYAATFLLPAVLVCVLGGVNPSGGFGNLTGIVLALSLLQILQSGFNILGSSSFFKNVIWGAMLLIVMVINYFGDRYARRGIERRPAKS
ncbi:MAG: ABC transporter permease [Actinobacteria bacterium]|nr:ABC transporter permease [Actinomycetota bacterium]